jgi:RNA polymerase sigma-70 factor (ECF subfamily)
MAMMPSRQLAPNSDEGGRTWFEATHWTTVLAAGDSKSPEQIAALNKLCSAYRPAILAYIRSLGYRQEEAEDLTQNFFQHLLTKKALAALNHNKGRFRAFLRKALKNFLANEWDKKMTEKRGGNVKFIPIQPQTSSSHGPVEPANGLTPDKIWDRNWAMTVIKNAWERLERDYARRNESKLFEILRDYVAESQELPAYAVAAAEVGKSENAFKMAVKRVRDRFGEMVRAEIAKTVDSAEAVEEEIRYLFEVVGS